MKSRRIILVIVAVIFIFLIVGACAMIPINYEKSNIIDGIDLEQKLQDMTFSIYENNEIELTEDEVNIVFDRYVLPKVMSVVDTKAEVTDVRCFLEENNLRCMANVKSGAFKATVTANVDVSVNNGKVMITVKNVKAGILSVPKFILNKNFSKFMNGYVVDGGKLDYFNFKDVIIKDKSVTVVYKTNNDSIIGGIQSEKLKEFSKEIVRIFGESENSIKLSNELIKMAVKYKSGSQISVNEVYGVIKSYFSNTTLSQNIEIIKAIKVLLES